MRCLRNLERKGFAAVDDTYSNTLEVREIVAREEDALCVTAQIGGRAHPVEKQSVFSIGRGRVIYVTAGIDTKVLNRAAIHFCKERAEPPWMLVINREW